MVLEYELRVLWTYSFLKEASNDLWNITGSGYNHHQEKKQDDGVKGIK